MKKKFNLFDIIIIVAVVFALASAYVMFDKTSGTSAGSNTQITFTVEVKNNGNNLKDSVKIGDKVYDSIKGGYYGEVVDVQSNPASVIVADTQNGEYKLKEYNHPDDMREDVYITIKGTPTSMTEENIQFANQKVKIGSYAYLESANFVAYGYVVGIDILE